MAAVLLGAWLFVRGQRRGLLLPMAAIFFVAAVRCVLFSERTAIIELLLPLGIVGLRSHVLGRRVKPLARGLLFAAPVLGGIGFVAFFGFCEYFRSWKYYETRFDSYADFTVWRLSGYFTTAHNNGAMALATDQPRPLPYFTLRPLWEFPGIRATPFSYQSLTGVDVPKAHERMLERFGTIELNNEGGLFQPALDYGFGGFLVYWAAYGFISFNLYRRLMAGTLAGVLLYPLFYMSILGDALDLVFVLHTHLSGAGGAADGGVAGEARRGGRAAPGADVPGVGGPLAPAIDAINEKTESCVEGLGTHLPTSVPKACFERILSERLES